jgi:hypothetical protein
MSQVVPQFAVPPMFIGRYYAADEKRTSLAMSASELERARAAMVRVLATFHFRTGGNVMVTAQFDEPVQLLGAERGIMSYGLVAVSAASTPYDGSRIEMIARRFAPVAALGITAGTLDGLAKLGYDAAKVFANMVVWARPDAYERLAALPGLRVFRWLEVGPAVAIECSAGNGAHIDHFEWDVDTEDGEIVLTSRLERCEPFKRYRTGVRGRVLRAACTCGNLDPRVVIDSAP